MPFEFTGKPPALSAAPTSFASFATSSNNPSTSAASFGFGVAPSLSTSFGASSRSAAPSPSPGLQIQNSASNAIKANDPLSRALVRAAEGRPAFFGAADVGGDALLRAYTEEQLDVPSDAATLRTTAAKLSGELVTLAKQYPSSASLLRFIFEKAARSEGDDYESMSLARGRDQPAQAADEDDKDLCSELVPVIHEKLCQMGWASRGVHHRDGYALDANAKVVCRLALDCRSKAELVEGIREEGIGKWEADQVLLALVDWLLLKVVMARKAQTKHEEKDGVREIVPDEAAAAPAGPSEQVTETDQLEKSVMPAWIPKKSHTQELQENMSALPPKERLAAMLRGRYVAPGYFGDKYNTAWEKTLCCEKPTSVVKRNGISKADKTLFALPPIVVDGHRQLVDEDTALLKVWLITHLGLFEDVELDPDILSEYVLAVVKQDDVEARVRPAAAEALEEFLGASAQPFVDDVFHAIARKAYRVDYNAKEPRPFRFLDLPPELRTWVYWRALVPSEVRLISCKHRNAYGVSPALTLGLLSTCRQINSEAKGLIFENKFVSDAQCCTSPTWMFNQKQLPHHVLPQLVSLTITLVVKANGSEWRQLQAMTGLKELRICGLEYENFQSAEWVYVLESIMTSVPKGCSILIGSESADERTHCEEMMDRLNSNYRVFGGDLTLSNTEFLSELAAKMVPHVSKGAKSGNSGLFYFDGEGKLVHI